MRALLACVLFLGAGAMAVGVAHRATVVHTMQGDDAARFFASVVAEAGMTYFMEGGECGSPEAFADRCNKLTHDASDRVVVIGDETLGKWFEYVIGDTLTDARFITDGGLFGSGAYTGTRGMVTVESNIGFDEYGSIWIGQAGLVLPIRAE